MDTWPFRLDLFVLYVWPTLWPTYLPVYKGLYFTRIEQLIPFPLIAHVVRIVGSVPPSPTIRALPIPVTPPGTG